jgi:hypothetical protein
MPSLSWGKEVPLHNQWFGKTGGAATFRDEVGYEQHWYVSFSIVDMSFFLWNPGYKLCEKINKSLKACVNVIQSALKCYNEAAMQLNPPRSSLMWETVVNPVTVADLDLLCDTHQDIWLLHSAQAANQEGMIMFFGIKHVKEEICQLNVEICHLLTFLYDNYINHYCAICRHIRTNLPLAHEIIAHWSYQLWLHEVIVKWLIQMSQLPGFSGSLFHGKQEGHDPALKANIPPLPWVMDLLKITEVIDKYEEEEPTEPISMFDADIDTNTNIFIELLENLVMADHA